MDNFLEEMLGMLEKAKHEAYDYQEFMDLFKKYFEVNIHYAMVVEKIEKKEIAQAFTELFIGNIKGETLEETIRRNESLEDIFYRSMVSAMGEFMGEFISKENE